MIKPKKPRLSLFDALGLGFICAVLPLAVVNMIALALLPSVEEAVRRGLVLTPFQVLVLDVSNRHPIQFVISGVVFLFFVIYNRTRR